MTQRNEYRLKIEAYTPETMPMKRLLEYLNDMVELLGAENRVHLVGIESSSTCPVVLVDPECEPAVSKRLALVRNQEGPEDAMKAAKRIDERLSKDNCTGSLLTPSREKIIEFPGAGQNRSMQWPSINQQGHLVGVPIKVGGKLAQVPVELQDGDKEYYVLASREKAKEIAAHLFTSTIRVSGRGRWRKAPGGPWVVERFIVESFEMVEHTDFDSSLEQLRSIDAEWKRREDALLELDKIRHSA